MRLETGHRLHLLRGAHRETIYIDRLRLSLAEEIDGLPIRGEHGVSILTGAIRQVGMLTRGHVIEPNIPRHAGGMVFAPLILEPFPILIEEAFATLVERDHLGRCTQDLAHLSTRHGHRIQLGHRSRGEKHAAGRILQRRTEKHLLAIGRESRGDLRCGVVGQSFGRSTLSRHHEKIHIAIPVTGESDLLTVGRPNGRTFITGCRGQLVGLPTSHGYLIDITFITKGDLLSRRRDLRITQPQRSGG